MHQKSRITRSLRELRSDDDAAAFRAQMRLVQMGAEALPELLKAASDADPRVRSRAAYILGRLRDSSAFDRLSEMTVDPERSVRCESVLALGQLGDPRAIPYLVQRALPANGPGDLTGAAATALISLADYVNDELAQFISDLPLEVRESVLRLMLSATSVWFY